MVIDTSALVAILFAEPEADRLVDAILAAGLRLVGAPSAVEASAVVLARRGAAGAVGLQALVEQLDLQVVAMSREAASIAAEAYARFGKGVGSPGVLNYGDCLSYGVARDLRQPLLFTGEDFPRTDVEPAAY